MVILTEYTFFRKLVFMDYYLILKLNSVNLSTAFSCVFQLSKEERKSRY